MARFSSLYKQRYPTARVTQGENTYEKGMMWSNQALGAGYTHTLLNLDSDSITGALSVPGGFSVNKLGLGSTYIDVLQRYDTDNVPYTSQVIVAQSRNNDFLRAFEGINNIISVTKTNTKDLLKKVRTSPQYLNNAKSVDCYKVITYNPFNHRTNVITMLEVDGVDYFLDENDLKIYRLNANKVSQGFSERWGNYITNITDLYPKGNTDRYTVRPHKVRYSSTFGSDLFYDYHMRSLAHTEGYGNKTFLFMKDSKVFEPSKEHVPTEKYFIFSELTENSLTLSTGFKVGDYISFEPVGSGLDFTYDKSLDLIRKMVIKVTKVSEEGKIIDYQYVQIGVLSTHFIESNLITPSSEMELTWESPNSNGDIGATTPYATYNYTLQETKSWGDFMKDSEYSKFESNDKYILKHTQPTWEFYDNLKDPRDLNTFGWALGSIAIVNLKSDYEGVNLRDVRLESVSPDSPDSLDPLEIVNRINTISEPIGLNLDTGELSGSNMSFLVNPVLYNTSYTTNKWRAKSITDLRSLFSQGEVIGTSTFIPDKLNIKVKEGIKPGQVIRVIAKCRIDDPISDKKNLSNLRDDVELDHYYTKRIGPNKYTSIFILEYTWNGSVWEFSFIDTAYIPDEFNPYTFPTSQVLSYGTDTNNIKFVTPYQTGLNKLAYIDIVTPDNISDMLDSNIGPIGNLKEGTSYYYSGIADFETLEPIATGSQGAENSLDLNYSLGDIFQTGLSENSLRKLNNTQNGTFIIEPRSLMPAEALKWGYNMLSPNPYLFECNNIAGPPLITGILFMKDGLPYLNPLVNTLGDIYIYYNSDFNEIGTSDPKYQLTLQHKNAYGEWDVLKTYTLEETQTSLSSGNPIRLAYTGTDENMMIRVTLFDTTNSREVVKPDGTKETIFETVSNAEYTINFTKAANRLGTLPAVYDLGTCIGMTYWKGRLVCWGVEEAPDLLFLSEPNDPTYFAYPNGVDTFDEAIKHVIRYSDSLVVFTSTKLWRLDMSPDGLSWNKTLIQQNIKIDENDIPYIISIKNMIFFKSGNQFFLLVPQSSGTIGSTSIAPISKSVTDFLNNPFDNIQDLLRVPLLDLKNTKRPLKDYLVKYGTHIEQDKIFVNWYFDMRSYKVNGNEPNDYYIVEDYKGSEYLLVQFIYDTSGYSWSLRTHTVSNIGLFISDSTNRNTDYVSLVYNPEILDKNGNPLFYASGLYAREYNKGSFGISISNRSLTPDKLIKEITFNFDDQLKKLEPTLKRVQSLDTGFKEVSTPALKKRFREVQMMFEPKSSRIGFEPIMSFSIDGNEVITETVPEVTYDTDITGDLEIKVVDKINYQNSNPRYYTTDFTTDAELSNTFKLDSSTFSGIKNIKIRRAVNGKGYLSRLKFTNLTETEYILSGHTFVYKSKNSR